MMVWYCTVGKHQNLITPEDYDFLYNLWNNGVTSYDVVMKNRLNKIRELYKYTNVL